ncbi:MAG: uracil-DNA glycosylase [Bacteroidota bacterium]|nr:uracil-DNA glycosylase [Bacteroidota bacterium]
MDVRIEGSWKKELDSEFQKDYFIQLISFLKKSKEQNKVIYPPGSLIFNAFDVTPFDQVKVVILGQDPYHGPNEAMGLSFSVPKGIRVPPSLLNIYKEIQRAFGYPIPSHGDLTSWAKQGVLLLNASLTVEQNVPNSHKHIGWHHFTDRVIEILATKKTGLVFLLWGNFARSKKQLIPPNKHLILESLHPSPLAGGGFFGNDHFKKTNEFLIQSDRVPINWEIGEKF